MIRRVAILVAITAALVAAAIGFYSWKREKPASIPEPALEDADQEYRAAVVQAQTAIRGAPKSADAWGGLGKIFRSGGYREPAAECFAEAARLNPANPRWPYLRGEALIWSNPQTSIDSLRQAVARCDQAHVEELAPRLRLAKELLANGQVDEAEDQLQRVLEADPQHPVAHLLLGRAAYARNNLPQSREHWMHCLDNPFTRQQANNHLAELCQRSGDPAAAEKYQRQANSLPADRNWPDPWLQECLLEGTGIAARFRRVEQLEHQGRTAEAVDVLSGIVAEQPDYKAYVALGKELSTLGDLSGAEKALRQALELNPKGLQAQYYLGRVFWAQAEEKRKAGADAEASALLEQSVESARRTVEQKPDYGLAYLSMGIALKQLHRNGEAAEALRNAIRIVPDLPDSYLHLADLLAAEGKIDDARQILQQALPLTKPEDRRVRDALAKLEPTKK